MLIAVFISLLLLVVFALFHIHALDDAEAIFALSEQGPYEQLSLVFWLLLAAYIVWRWRPGNASVYCLAAGALIAAGREASLHKAFYGVSVLKVNFYTLPDVPLLHKLLIGSVVLILLAALLYSLWLLIDWLRQGGWRRESGQIMIVGVGLLVGTKVLDRLNSVLRVDFDIRLSALVAENVVILEESLEMALPLVLLIAAWRLWREQQESRPT